MVIPSIAAAVGILAILVGIVGLAGWWVACIVGGAFAVLWAILTAADAARDRGQ